MLQQDFMLDVLAGTVLAAAVCSYLGVFIVLRRAVFVGAALAQTSSLGIALALFLTGVLESSQGIHMELPPQPIALALTVVAAVAMAAQRRERHLPRETLIGVAYVAAAGLAILLVAMSTHAESEVLNLLFGNVLAIDRAEVAVLALLGLAVAIVHGLFFKEFVFVSFDPDMATALGLRTRQWNVLLFVTVGVAISLAIRACGALVVFDFLVLPAATALLFGRSLRFAFATAVLVGVSSAVAGISISYVADLPSGPTIVAVSAVVLFAVMAGTRVRS